MLMTAADIAISKQHSGHSGARSTRKRSPKPSFEKLQTAINPNPIKRHRTERPALPADRPDRGDKVSVPALGIQLHVDETDRHGPPDGAAKIPFGIGQTRRTRWTFTPPHPHQSIASFEGNSLKNAQKLWPRRRPHKEIVLATES